MLSKQLQKDLEKLKATRAQHKIEVGRFKADEEALLKKIRSGIGFKEGDYVTYFGSGVARVVSIGERAPGGGVCATLESVSLVDGFLERSVGLSRVNIQCIESVVSVDEMRELLTEKARNKKK